MQKIQEAKKQNPDNKEYKNRELIYILNKLAKEFIKDFHCQENGKWYTKFGSLKVFLGPGASFAPYQLTP